MQTNMCLLLDYYVFYPCDCLHGNERMDHVITNLSLSILTIALFYSILFYYYKTADIYN